MRLLPDCAKRDSLPPKDSALRRLASALPSAAATVPGLLYLNYLTELSWILRVALLVAWAAGIVAARRSGRWLPAVALGGTILWIALFALFQEPSHHRDWVPEQARLPLARFNGDLVSIENFRNISYRAADDFDVRWETRTFDLSRVRTIDYAIEPFHDWRGLAHVFVTFGFEGGEHVAISVEIRREKGETYSPIRGLFRQYEVVYIVGDERDLIGLRANHRRHPVYLFPLRARADQARTLLEAMLARANRIADRPEYYNSLTSSCASNIAGQLESLGWQRFGWDWRLLFPGYSDEIAMERGLIDFDGPLDAARERFLINRRSAPAQGQDERAWSRQIRTLDGP